MYKSCGKKSTLTSVCMYVCTLTVLTSVCMHVCTLTVCCTGLAEPEGKWMMLGMRRFFVLKSLMKVPPMSSPWISATTFQMRNANKHNIYAHTNVCMYTVHIIFTVHMYVHTVYAQYMQNKCTVLHDVANLMYAHKHNSTRKCSTYSTQKCSMYGTRKCSMWVKKIMCIHSFGVFIYICSYVHTHTHINTQWYACDKTRCATYLHLPFHPLTSSVASQD